MNRYDPVTDKIIEYSDDFCYHGGTFLRKYSELQENDQFHRARARTSIVKDFLEHKVSKRLVNEKHAQARLETLKRFGEKLNALEAIYLSIGAGELNLGIEFLSKEGIIGLAMEFLKFPSFSSAVALKDLLHDFPPEFDSPLARLNFELEWIKMWQNSCENFFIEFEETVRSGLFDCNYIDTNWSPHGTHPWHDHLDPRGRDPIAYKFVAKRRATDYVPTNRIDLFDALICALTAIQVYNFKNQSGPYSRCIAYPYPYYIDFNDLNGNEANIEDLKLAIRKWTNLVYCQTCKLPGCYSSIICPTAPALMVDVPLDFASHGDICKSVHELDPSAYDVFESLIIYFNNQITLEVVFAYGFAVSKILGEMSYHLAAKSIIDFKNAEELSRVLLQSGAVVNSAASALMGLEDLAKLCDNYESEGRKPCASINAKFSEVNLSAALDQILERELPGWLEGGIKDFDDLSSKWRHRSVVLDLDKIDGLIGLSQRLSLLREERALLSISFAKEHSFPARHRELVMKKLFSANAKHVLETELVKTLLLAAYLVCFLPEGSKIIFYHQSACLSTANPEAVIKNLRAIGLNFLECFSEEAAFLDDVVFTSKFARANNIVSAFSRLFTVHERLKNADQKTIVEEYASAAWSLVNRSGNKYAAMPLAARMHKMTGLELELCRRIFLGEVSVSFGPVRKAKDGHVDVLFFKVPEFEIDFELPEVEVEALQFLKSQPSGFKLVSLEACDSEPTLGSTGYLSSFKVLSGLKCHLDRQELAQILRIVGCPRTEADEFERAWGRNALPKVIHGALPYESEFHSSMPQVPYQIFY